MEPAVSIGTGGSESEGRLKVPVSLTEELQQLLVFLHERHGVAVVEESIAPLASGPHCLTLQSPDFRLRFVRDVGHLSAEVGQTIRTNGTTSI